MNNTNNTNNKMKLIKIFIEDRQYSTWSFCCPDTKNVITEDDIPEVKYINPIEYKLFSRDIFTISMVDEKPVIKIIYPYIKSCTYIAGILQLENNKTYGRTVNKKRLLYKCIPDDKRLPSFLVPYDMKIGFSKVIKNKYVTFKYDHWNDKHPQGLLLDTLGDVDNLEVFYEYQLYCKSLHISLTDFTNRTREFLNKKTADEYVEQIYKNTDFKIEDRRNEYIFTIDPLNSTDFDDGFSISKIEDDKWKIGIYISNVYFWLETFGLWNSFSNRVATIYLPDRRRPMLPTILSDTLCSLQKGKLRFALAMDVIVDNDGNVCNDNVVNIKNVLINVKKNYIYEDHTMIAKDNYYKQLFDISLKMDNTIKNSHDIVSHWMVHMNTHIGKFMFNKKVGIFRSANYINPNLRDLNNQNIDDDTMRIIKTWNNTIGQYIQYNEGVDLRHEIMNVKSYSQITSPIRRLVDLLNLMILSKHISLVDNISNDADIFVKNWLNELDYLNSSMRSIRKIQTDCDVLHRCYNNPDIMTTEYNGVLFDKINKNDGKYSYMVYLKQLKLLSRFTSQESYENYSQYSFNIYLFENEEKSRKKIRLQMI